MRDEGEENQCVTISKKKAATNYFEIRENGGRGGKREREREINRENKRHTMDDIDVRKEQMGENENEAGDVEIKEKRAAKQDRQKKTKAGNED